MLMQLTKKYNKKNNCVTFYSVFIFSPQVEYEVFWSSLSINNLLSALDVLRVVGVDDFVQFKFISVFHVYTILNFLN